jgi:hypothetical protein
VSAKKFYEVAELVASDGDTVPASASVAAALAVLAGIAAADGACCAALGHRSRGADHRQAIDLLKEVVPDGAEAAKHLGRLLDVKDTSHYGVIYVSRNRLKTALRSAQARIEFAESCVRR